MSKTERHKMSDPRFSYKDYLATTMEAWQRTGWDYQRVAVSRYPFHNREEGFTYFIVPGLSWKKCSHVMAVEAALKLIAAEAIS